MEKISKKEKEKENWESEKWTRSIINNQSVIKTEKDKIKKYESI